MAIGRHVGALVALFGLGVVAPAWADDLPSYEINIEGHVFHPSTLQIPAHKKVKLIVKNQDKSAEEFESYQLNREKLVAGKSQITVYVGPLDPGTYPFFGDFNQATAQGKLVVQ